MSKRNEVQMTKDEFTATVMESSVSAMRDNGWTLEENGSNGTQGAQQVEPRENVDLQGGFDLHDWSEEDPDADKV